MKIKDKVICTNCGSNKTQCLGGVHYVKTGEGMGHERRTTGYKCNSCGNTWNE